MDLDTSGDLPLPCGSGVARGGPQHRLHEARRDARATVAARRTELMAVAGSAASEGRDDEHDPDGATVAFEHALAAGLLRRAEEHLRAVDEAINRLEEGTYGRCSTCGRQIGAARLATEPAASDCVQCATLQRPASGTRPFRSRRPHR